MSTDYWKRINYKTPVKYFINTYIREYDLSKANVTALLYQNRLSLSEYNEYLTMSKELREKKIGLLIRSDRSIYKDIQAGIIEAKKRLLTLNSVEDFNIVSIKNDAVFIVGNELMHTCFPPFEFKIKNVYNIFLQLQDLEIYYGDFLDPSSGNINTTIDIKGISDERLARHQGGMLDIICDTCYRLQRENIQSTMTWICEMYRQFLTRSLSKQYYRNLDAFSGYTFKTSVHVVSLQEIDDTMIPVVDINRNLSILRDLVGIVSDIYRQQCK